MLKAPLYFFISLSDLYPAYRPDLSCNRIPTKRYSKVML
ncbi:hypothetical protein MNB_SV-10-422 [hydrothermal vent metagenome]|uniref:Uncharacterized protein n=1 Tax=hydrothermal vent metagenome TaxID=652676 RepID=A0A1W1BLN8_9ZZZZ